MTDSQMCRNIVNILGEVDALAPDMTDECAEQFEDAVSGIFARRTFNNVAEEDKKRTMDPHWFDHPGCNTVTGDGFKDKPAAETNGDKPDDKPPIPSGPGLVAYSISGHEITDTLAEFPDGLGIHEFLSVIQRKNPKARRYGLEMMLDMLKKRGAVIETAGIWELGAAAGVAKATKAPAAESTTTQPSADKQPLPNFHPEASPLLIDRLLNLLRMKASGYTIEYVQVSLAADPFSQDEVYAAMNNLAKSGLIVMTAGGRWAMSLRMQARIQQEILDTMWQSKETWNYYDLVVKIARSLDLEGSAIDEQLRKMETAGLVFADPQTHNIIRTDMVADVAKKA